MSAKTTAAPKDTSSTRSPLISLVVPCFNEEESLPIFLRETNKIIQSMRDKFGCSFEYVLVDDGSSDETLKVIRSAAEQAEALAEKEALSRNKALAEKETQSIDKTLAEKEAPTEEGSLSTKEALVAGHTPAPTQAFTAEHTPAPMQIFTTEHAPTAKQAPTTEETPSTTGGTLASSSNSHPTLVRWISFSRNFGKEAALLAGLEAAQGDFVATMDADMQDPPSLLPKMYQILLEEGYDDVATRRATREGEPVIRSTLSHLFYKVINRISETDFVEGERDYRLMKRTMVDAVLSMKERNRFSKGLYEWVGFKTAWVSYNNIERVAGSTKWGFSGLMRYSFDGISSFSTAPLLLSSALSVLLCLLAIVGIAIIVVRKLFFGNPVDGWASLACIILFVGGLQLLCTGILGQYLAKTYLESKQRPSFIVRESHV